MIGLRSDKKKLFLCKVENQLGTYSPDVCLVVVAVDDWASMDQVSCSDTFWDLLDKLKLN